MADIFNISEFNDDPFREIVSEKPVQEELISVYSHLYYVMYFTDTIKLILSVVVLVADGYLASMIYKDKKKTRTKTFIMHYAICHILIFVSSPLFYILIDIINIMKYTGYRFYFFLRAIEQLSVTLGLLLAFGLGLEWLYIVYNPKLNYTGKYIYDNLIPIFYGLTLFQFTVECMATFFTRIRYIGGFIVRIVLFFVFTFLILCNFLKYRKGIILQTKKDYSLTIANIIVFSWIPLYIIDILLNLTYNNEFIHAILLFLWFVPEWIAFGNTLIIIFVLARRNIYFQNYYERIFRKSIKRCDDEENLNELLDNLARNNVRVNENN